MSVRATGSLIADLVVISGSKAPQMVVLSVDEEKKQVTAFWFSADLKGQQAVFPASALDRVEKPAPAAAKKSAPKGKT
jgi:hypothetical protein